MAPPMRDGTVAVREGDGEAAVAVLEPHLLVSRLPAYLFAQVAPVARGRVEEAVVAEVALAPEEPVRVLVAQVRTALAPPSSSTSCLPGQSNPNRRVPDSTFGTQPRTAFDLFLSP